MSPQVPADEANRLIIQTIRGILGNEAAAVFFQQLDKRVGITQSEVVKSPEALRGLLEGIFGSGGQVIERSILVALSERFDPNILSMDLAEALVELVGGAAPQSNQSL